MPLLEEIRLYIEQNPFRCLDALQAHGLLSFSAISASALIAIPMGFLCAKKFPMASGFMALSNALRVIPSLAILALMVPFFGAGFTAALIALILLALPPLLINTATGFSGIPHDTLEAAEAMGMTRWGIFKKIECPLAVPAIITGFKIASVEVISGATLAAFMGGGGLGVFIINGLSMASIPLLLIGALPVGLMALAAQGGFSLLEHFSKRYAA